MSFERGGRSDKQGNIYENRYLAMTLIRLISEEIISVVVEPVGDNTDICEFYTIGKDGRKTYYQCKGSNEMKDHWTPSDLQKYNLFTKVQKVFRSDPECEFRFISPLYYDGLDDLCSRAKMYSSAQSYLENALSNNKLQRVFEACEKYLGLNRVNTDQLNELINFLSRCEFLVQPNNSDTIQHLDQLISVYFWGVAGNTRVLLENYVNDTALYGKELTVTDVIKYLSEKGIQSRILLSEMRIAPAISRLNSNFSESYNAIRGGLFHRSCTESLIQGIKAGKSIVLHGRAGTGKSGCIRELISYLDCNHIDYLAIQLDKHIPNDYADKYGEMLGLPGSPVNSLSLLSGSKQCVLILDQLDALRWTSMHSFAALDVCKEMLTQVRGINENTNGHISVVFSVRTFDYENDAGIRALFTEKKEEKREPLWTEINIGRLTDDEVKQIIGEEYKTLSGRTKELVRIPSSLYVWLKLDSKRRLNRISSTQEMVQSWWDQIQDKYDAVGHNRNALAKCINELVTAIINSASFALPKAMFLQYTHELEYLASGGMLIIENNRVSFAHQSFLDSFLLEKDLGAIFKGEQNLLSLVLSWGSQMPMYRYRLSALFQNIVETNQILFSRQVKEFLESDQIHYYYKAVAFEIIGQLTAPINEIYKIIDEYFGKTEWHRLILQTVYERHLVFIEHLSKQQRFDWSSEEGCSLLVSLSLISPKLVASILRKMMEIDVASSETLLSVIGMKIDTESEEMFAVRMDSYRRDYTLLASIRFINLECNQPDHVIQVLALFLAHMDVLGDKHIYIDDKKRQQFCKDNYISIINSLFPSLCSSAKNTPLSLHNVIFYRERYWLPRQGESSIAREIVELVKTSLKIIAKDNPEKALYYILEAGNFKNGISNELALSTLLEVPSNYSDAAIEWLLSDFDCHILDCISNEYDFLATCKSILVKHSSFCSQEVFKKLEDRICTWKGDRERFINNYRQRIEFNRAKEQGPVYWPAWGHLQKALLPSLNSSRTSKRTKELLLVLNRNDWIQSNYYHAGVLSGPAKAVVSAIHENAARLSDRTWLEIINSDVDVQHSGIRGKNDKTYYYESSHWAFSQDLGSCVKNDPVRYAKLLLKFPHDCFPCYYTAVLYRLTVPKEQANGFQLLCDVIRHSMDMNDDSIPIAITHIINDNLEEEWPEDIISYLIGIANGNLKPGGNESVVSSRVDDTLISSEDMVMAVLNSPRGAVIDTIGELLRYHLNILDEVAPLIEKLAQDESDVIRFALVKCAVAYYDYNPSFSKILFDMVLEKDLRVLFNRFSFRFMSRDLLALEKYYFPFLKEACNSSNLKLVSHAAQQICMASILTSSEKLLEFLYSYSWTEESMDKICSQATYAFEIEKYREISQRILEHFLGISAGSLKSINCLFHGNLLDLSRDERFIKDILQKRKSIDTIDAFIDFIKNQDRDLSGYSGIIKTAVDSIEEDVPSWEKCRIEDGLVHAVIKLIDVASGDDALTECCLDILDKIYQKRILTDSSIFELMDGNA